MPLYHSSRGLPGLPHAALLSLKRQYGEPGVPGNAHGRANSTLPAGRRTLRALWATVPSLSTSCG